MAKSRYSSVLDGSGTGGTVTGWAGSGTSNTLTNSPITFSGNNTSFPDDATFDTNIILEGNIYHKNDTNIYFGFNPGASEDDTIIFNTAGSERDAYRQFWIYKVYKIKQEELLLLFMMEHTVLI